jgi:hypothetical protein
MTDNTYFFWVADHQLPFLQEQFKDSDVLKVLTTETDGTVKVAFKAEDGLGMYKLLLAGYECGKLNS